MVLGSTGVICTLPNECDALRYAMDTPTIRSLGQRQFLTGHLAGRKIVLVRSPMGKSENSITATLLAQSFGVDRIISMGTAGSLVEELPIGSILMTDKVFAHDEGRFLNIGFVTYRTKPVAEPVTSTRVRAATVFNGLLTSGDQFIALPDKAQSIRRLTNGHAVDTNSIAIKTVCNAFDIDCIFFRYISDMTNEKSAKSFKAATRRDMKPYATVVRHWIMDNVD